MSVKLTSFKNNIRNKTNEKRIPDIRNKRAHNCFQNINLLVRNIKKENNQKDIYEKKGKMILHNNDSNYDNYQKMELPKGSGSKSGVATIGFEIQLLQKNMSNNSKNGGKEKNNNISYKDKIFLNMKNPGTLKIKETIIYRHQNNADKAIKDKVDAKTHYTKEKGWILCYTDA